MRNIKKEEEEGDRKMNERGKGKWIEGQRFNGKERRKTNREDVIDQLKLL